MKFSKEYLDKVSATLHKEFIGIDNIINSIMKNIQSWNNDCINKPIVVPIFGFTGCGKTSLINRLIELLNYQDKSIHVTLSSDSSDGSNYCDNKLLSKFRVSDFSSIKDISSDSILVFDEFQKIRTKDESGKEKDNDGTSKWVWELLDGYSSSIFELDYNVNRARTCTKRFIELFNSKFKDISFELGERLSTTDRKLIDILKSFNYTTVTDKYDMFFRESLNSPETGDYWDEMPKSNITPLVRHFRIIPGYLIQEIKEAVSVYITTKESEDIMNSMMSCKNTKELSIIFNQIKDIISKQPILDLHRALIFVIGNIDEAFMDLHVSDTDPDIDADTLHKRTSLVNATDIKAALRSRFRPEQIARLGNNIVIYPTFSKEAYYKIIKSYLDKELNNFRNANNIKLAIRSNNIYDLIYSEGVYPTQGARCVISTINNFISIFNDILHTANNLNNNATTIKSITIHTDCTNFRQDSVRLYVNYYNDEEYFEKIHTEIFIYDLELGRLRNPKNNPASYSTTIHELGHAFLNIILTGYVPSNVNICTISGGGFCEENIKLTTDIKFGINKAIDVNRKILILLGGWAAEKLILGKNLSSLGSSSDLNKAWILLRDSYYNCGYDGPIRYSNSSFNNSTVPVGAKDDKIIKKISKDLERLSKKAIKLLKPYKNLIKILIDDFLKLGSVSEEEFNMIFARYSEMPEVKLLLSNTSNELTKSIVDNTIVEKFTKLSWFERLKLNIKLFILDKF